MRPICWFWCVRREKQIFKDLTGLHFPLGRRSNKTRNDPQVQHVVGIGTIGIGSVISTVYDLAVVVSGLEIIFLSFLLLLRLFLMAPLGLGIASFCYKVRELVYDSIFRG